MSKVTLKDIGLKDYTLDTIPRLKELREKYFNLKPEICIERARYVTEYLRDIDDGTDPPVIKRAKTIRHFLSNKAPVFHDGNLLAGSTTSKPLGAPLFPEFFALTLWPELRTVSTREHNPQILKPEDADLLNKEIFPYWMDKNVLEVSRSRFGTTTGHKLFEDLVFFIAGKAGCISHAVPTYEPMLQKGLLGIIEQVNELEKAVLGNPDPDAKKRADFYRAVAISLEGIIDYANSLADMAQILAEDSEDPEEKKHYQEIASCCRHVPAHPARSFREAVNAIWICQVGIHAENINMAMSPGRLDQVLFPYYKKDVEKGVLDIAKAIEILGCLWLKLSDNVIMVPEASEEMFGGAGTVPALTLGGVDEEGQDAVNDLTYIMLRVTELLRIRDPNVNARYHYEKNTQEYLERVSEVILNTKAVPAIYNDVANIAALVGQGESIEHARDYAIVGCVELASSGRDYPSSSSIMLNLVAPFEMALFQGKRPITGEEQIGPKTQDPTEMTEFEQFKKAFYTQLDWLIDKAIAFNEDLGRVHQEMLPTPLLSAFFHGPIESGKDLIFGGALYNSSGATHIGFADVVDSLNAIEKAVFEEKRFDFSEILEAVKDNFSGEKGRKIRAYLTNKCPKYGTEDPIALKNSKELVEHLFNTYQSYTNYRGGPYRPAYWTMTNHAGLGGISGALPNGRKAQQVFSSGITPCSGAAPELTACLNAVAALGGPHIPGGWALNLKYTPGPVTKELIKTFSQTHRAYFMSGGHQVQFNIMTYEELMEAKNDPNKYPELMVRVSGYSAYFKDLNEMMKDELIRRSQYDLDTGQFVPYPFEL